VTSKTLSRAALVVLALVLEGLLAFAPACPRASVIAPARRPLPSWTVPNLVSTFAMETMQGSTDFMLILVHDVLLVVHRFTDDGACPVTVAQGPLSTCADMKWELFADVRITGEPRAREAVVELDAARTATPFDCKSSYSGQRLVEP
jgi:hypothetical protein